MFRYIFFGTDQYSAIVLASLLAASQPVLAVVTDPPKPEKHGGPVLPNPVEKLASIHNIKVIYYKDNNDNLSNFLTQLKSLLSKAKNPLGILASFGHILPPPLLSLFPKGIFCLHPSLLPKYRGATPVPYAIALKDEETGLTIFRLTEKIDSGKIIAVLHEPILTTDTTPTLLNRLFTLGSTLLLSCLTASYRESPCKLPPTPYIYAPRFTRASGYIEWPVARKLIESELVLETDTQNPLLRLRLGRKLQMDTPHHMLHDLIRALTPWPTIWTTVPTQYGELRLTLTQVFPAVMVKLAGKPKAISWQDFQNYYLKNNTN